MSKPVQTGHTAAESRRLFAQIWQATALARFATLMHLVAVSAPIAALAENFVTAPGAHGLALYGEPALPRDFDHLPYANPDAPKGGTLRLVSAADLQVSIRSTRGSQTRRNSSSAMCSRASWFVRKTSPIRFIR
jgi:hypothetical protein